MGSQRVGHNWATFSLQIVQTWAFLCFTALICNWHSAQLSCVPTVLFSLRHNSLHPAFLSLIPCFFPLFHSMWLYIFSSSFSSVGLLWWLSVKESSCQCRGCSFNLWVENPLQKEMATHSIILAWRIPWTEESGGLQFMGLQRIRHDWVTKCNTAQHNKVEEMAESDPFQHLCITETLILVHKETCIRMLMWYVTICYRENGF